MTFYNSLSYNLIFSWSRVEVFLLSDFILSMILFILFFTLCFILLSYNSYVFRVKNINNIVILETRWTVYPPLLLISLAFPSLVLLYLLESPNTYDLLIKVIGHQWFWSYENSIFGIEIESYMKSSNNRLLDSNEVVLPFLSKIIFLITSDDVLHSFALPSIGLKLDAVPSRLNSFMVEVLTPGIIYGECSEICGLNHSKMPIKIEFTNWNNFLFSVIAISEN